LGLVSVKPELIRAHFGGVALALPLVFIFASLVLSDGLIDGLTGISVLVLFLEVIATLPWSAFAVFSYFLVTDPLNRDSFLWFHQVAKFLIPAILIFGAYFNGFQFGRYVSGLLKPKVEAQSKGSKSK